MLWIDPDNSFLPEIRAEYSNVFVNHSAKGGEPIKSWYDANSSQTGYLYDRLVTDTVRHRAKYARTVTLIWYQGETDAKGPLRCTYAESLFGLHRQICADLGRSDVNIVIGRLNDFYSEQYPAWECIRYSQVSVASDLGGKWINTDDLNGQDDDIHLTKEGYVEIGRRFALATKDLINQNLIDKIEW